MRPLYPAIFNEENLNSLKWANSPENSGFNNYLINTCREFPSLILACSARPGMVDKLSSLAESLISIGINVFMPPEPTPLCALSQAVSSRNLPLGLYLDTNENGNNFSLIALARHGGPPDEKDVFDAQPMPTGRTGVAGTTELDRYYASNISALADHFIEKGAGFSAVEIPFPALEERLRSMPELSALFQVDPAGPVARISADGQSLALFDKSGVRLAAELVAEKIARYLVKERLASGTIVGPAANFSSLSGIEKLTVNGSAFDMNYHAGFADLLIGWWPDGTISHQGSSCFGDAILSAIYYLEACRCQ